jgi:hypothetical protein
MHPFLNGKVLLYLYCFEFIQIKNNLTPKGRNPVFGPFLKFGLAIVDAIFVQKISTFR